MKMSTDHKEKASTSTETLVEPTGLEITDFAVLSKKPWYVDKTLFIKAVFESGYCYLGITAPRGFGKSANMDMLKKFVEIELGPDGRQVILEKDEAGYLLEEQTSKNFNLFKNTNIFTIEENGKRVFNKEFFTKHFGRYPVLYASFKGVKGDTEEEILDSCRGVISESFRQHEYLYQSETMSEIDKKWFACYADKHNSRNKSELIYGLEYLSDILCKYYRNLQIDNRRVYVLIEDYDTAVSNALCKPNKNLKPFIEIIGRIVSSLLKNNGYVNRSLINISHYVSYSHYYYNPFEVEQHPFFAFHDFYGFTGEEVKKLLQNRKLTENQMKALKDWFSIYNSSRENEPNVEIHSNWSVLRNLDKTSVFDKYLVSPSEFDMLENMVSREITRETLKSLVDGGTVNVRMRRLIHNTGQTVFTLIHTPVITEIRQDENELLMQFLFERGYLNVNSGNGYDCVTERRLYGYLLKVPNSEIRNQIRRVLYGNECEE